MAENPDPRDAARLWQRERALWQNGLCIAGRAASGCRLRESPPQCLNCQMNNTTCRGLSPTSPLAKIINTPCRDEIYLVRFFERYADFAHLTAISFIPAIKLAKVATIARRRMPRLYPPIFRLRFRARRRSSCQPPRKSRHLAAVPVLPAALSRPPRRQFL